MSNTHLRSHQTTLPTSPPIPPHSPWVGILAGGSWLRKCIEGWNLKASSTQTKNENKAYLIIWLTGRLSLRQNVSMPVAGILILYLLLYPGLYIFG